MRAIEISKPGVVCISEREKPRPDCGEVLLKINRVGYCGSDLGAFKGLNPLVTYPRVPGHEIGAATVGTIFYHVKLYPRLLSLGSGFNFLGAAAARIVTAARATNCALMHVLAAEQIREAIESWPPTPTTFEPSRPSTAMPLLRSVLTSSAAQPPAAANFASVASPTTTPSTAASRAPAPTGAPPTRVGGGRPGGPCTSARAPGHATWRRRQADRSRRRHAHGRRRGARNRRGDEQRG